MKTKILEKEIQKNINSFICENNLNVEKINFHNYLELTRFMFEDLEEEKELFLIFGKEQMLKDLCEDYFVNRKKFVIRFLLNDF